MISVYSEKIYVLDVVFNTFEPKPKNIQISRSPIQDIVRDFAEGIV